MVLWLVFCILLDSILILNLKKKCIWEIEAYIYVFTSMKFLFFSFPISVIIIHDAHASETTLMNMGKTDKHNKTQTKCIILGMYCSYVVSCLIPRVSCQKGPICHA